MAQTANQKTVATANATVVRIPTNKIEQVTLTVQGVGTGLLVHRFSETQVREMEAPTLGEAQGVRGPRNYQIEFEESRYVVDGKDVFPSATIKKRLVDGCSFMDGIFKTTARGAFFVLGEHVEILSDPPELHKAVVKVGKGLNKTAMVRIRALYRTPWKMRVPIRYDASIISLDQLVFLFVQTGFSIGFGDWRPQSSGSFGMFEVIGNGKGLANGRD